MIGMFTFEILEYALKRAKNETGPRVLSELTELVMKQTQELGERDQIFYHAEKLLMAFLLERELEASEPSFANICAVITSESVEDSRILSNLADSMKKMVAQAVRKRLSLFDGALAIARHSGKS